MKLVILLLVVACSAQRDHSQFNHQSFQIPPQFHANNIGPFVSQNSLYLPPETQTTLPYFPLKPNNGIPYPLLPITGTKAPIMFPSPLPIMSSTFRPHDDEDEEDNDIRQQPPAQRNYTRPQNQQMQPMKPEKELRPVPKSIPNNFNQIDRIDLKFQAEPGPGHSEQFQQAPQMIRRTLSTPSGVNPPFGNDNSIPDQLKTASQGGGHYIPPPPGYVPPTEPAIPILRLSNEMDLDGSFSYEALSADQTHYVQHSRIENAGTDHEEQVVEGSYSYVGDDGQTYTVHYVADSNGFRASGEHLPVPPPMPEIIQRAVQYNLAAEATRPHNQQGFYEDPQESEIRPRPVLPPPQYSPPQRNLFTGRPPEAFSHSHQNHNKDKATSSQNNNSNGGSNSNQNNNLQASASSQAPVIAHIDFMKEQNEKSSGSAPIAPQVTFLASQGAHVPSTPPPQSPPPISRRHYFGTEAPLFVQPIHNNFYKKQYDFMNNYVNDKNVWGYRYEPNRLVNSISRSSGDESDDIVINFNDMTSDQYSNILRTRFDNAERNYDKKTEFDSKIGYQSTDSPIISTTQKYYQNNEYTVPQYQPQQANYQPQPQLQYSPAHTPELGNNPIPSSLNTSSTNYYDNVLPNSTSTMPIKHEYTTKISVYSTSPMSSIDQSYETKHRNKIQSVNNSFESSKESRTYNYVDHSKLLTQKSFVPPSQMVTQSYDYEMEYYEPRKLQSRRLETLTTKTNENLAQPVVSVSSSSPLHDANETLIYDNSNYFRPLVTENSKTQSTEVTSSTSFLDSEKIDNFDKYQKDESFTTSKSTIATELQYSNEVENVQVKVLNGKEDENKSELAENIFLKNILGPDLPKNNSISRNDNSRFTPIVYVQKPDYRNKEAKHISNKSKHMNEIKKDTQTMPLDLSQILNFVTMKNHFESNKLKSKKISEQPINTNFENKSNQESSKHRYYTDQNDTQNDDNRSEKMQKIVKIYKTLQRNKVSPEQNIQQDLTPPSHDYKTLHMDTGKPPLGRAGPSMKSYLPPTYV